MDEWYLFWRERWFGRSLIFFRPLDLSGSAFGVVFILVACNYRRFD